MEFKRSPLPSNFNYASSPAALLSRAQPWQYVTCSESSIKVTAPGSKDVKVIISGRVFPVGKYPDVRVKFVSPVAMKDDPTRFIYASDNTDEMMDAIVAATPTIKEEIAKIKAALNRIYETHERSHFEAFYRSSASFKPAKESRDFAPAPKQPKLEGTPRMTSLAGKPVYDAHSGDSDINSGFFDW